MKASIPLEDNRANNFEGGHYPLYRSGLPQDVLGCSQRRTRKKRARSGTANNTREEFQKFLSPYQPAKAALEATRT